MKRLNLIVLTLLTLLIGSALYAQPRTIGGRSIILDDNAAIEAYITTSQGGIGINMLNMAPNACAILDLNSQTKGFLPPRMVPAEIAALCGGTPPEGLIVYNTLTHTLDIWNGSSWTGQWQTKGNTNLSADNVDNLLGSTALSTVKPFNLVVGGTRIMRYDLNNRIQGGTPTNTIHPLAHGAVIAGGGQAGNPNTISQHGLYSVIGGGRGNTANGQVGVGDAVVGGGSGNNAAGSRSTIGGGFSNTASSSGSSILGGGNNTISVTAVHGSIGGGSANTINTFGLYSTIAGGRNNTANGDGGAGDAFVGGGINNLADGARTTIGGGFFNTALMNASTIAGGADNTTTINAQYATIAGGSSNTVDQYGGFVGGGLGNMTSGVLSGVAAGYFNSATGPGAFVGGGGWNNAIAGGNTASGIASTIAGGYQNRATDDYTIVGGGQNNQAGDNAGTLADRSHAKVAGGWNNLASGHRSTIAGGQNNVASGDGASVGGGTFNSASGLLSTVSGGGTNSASATRAVVAGGQSNTASGNAAFVGAGQNNQAIQNSTVIGGGQSNVASGHGATIGGGGWDGSSIAGNTASGAASSIGGGHNNTATGMYANVDGGQNNTATTLGATVGGGQNNTSNNLQTVVSGGFGNTASGQTATVSGGQNNVASGARAVVGGGLGNTAAASTSTIGGGGSHVINASAAAATIAGGSQNQINAANSQNAIGGGGNNQINGTVFAGVISGGVNNQINGTASHGVISGGNTNIVTGQNGTIVGGQNLTVGTSTFGYNGSGAADISAQPNTAYFGNVDVLVSNTDNSAQQLRFYENNGSTTLAGADFASFQAPAVMTATTQYALPVNFGNAGGGIAPYILADVSGAGSPRQLTWISGNSSNWLLNGNSGIGAGNFIGTTDAADFVIKTGVGAIERMRFDGNPQLASNTDPLITITNTTANQQGLRINGTADANLASTLAANPGVWDLVVNGDAVVSGIFKMGGSLWFDAAPTADPHSMKANKRLLIGTTTNNDLTFMTNNSERMYVDSTGKVGIGTKDPVSALHIVATPPQAIPPDTNALGFVTPEPRHHVLTVENMYAPSQYDLYNRGNGIAVVIHTPDGTGISNDGLWNNSRTNYMTFYNDDGGKDNIRGRIEGFSYEDYLRMAAGLDVIMEGGELFNPFNWFSFNVDFFDFDPGFISFDQNFLTFNANFISFSGGSLPSLSGGSLPSLTGGSFSFTDGITWPTFSPGSLPSLNPGSLPSISWSAPVVLNGSPVIINGSPLINFENPFTLNQAYIDLKAAQIAALPYKEKAADAVMNPVGAAVKFGASFKAGVTYESGSGDYAEWLEREDPNEKINFGDVVGVKGGKISKNTSGTNQYMVATWKPIVLGNMPEPGREKDFTKVAFLGQIPVKIVGGCRKGDYILPSGRNDGFAFALAPSRIDAADLDKVLGIAWDDAYETSPRYVKIAVGLKPHEMVTVIQKQQAQIDNLQEKISEIELLKQEMAELKQAVTASQSSKVVSAKKSSKKPKFRYKTVSTK